MKANPEPKTLSEWLDIATVKLTAPAQERIRLEIEAHFAEALENHLADGMIEFDAQKAALQELGDATGAARRFRQKHLTENEAACIKRNLENSGSFFALSGSVITIPLYFYFSGHEPELGQFSIPCKLHIVVSFFIFLFALVRHEQAKRGGFRPAISPMTWFTILVSANIILFCAYVLGLVLLHPFYFYSLQNFNLRESTTASVAILTLISSLIGGLRCYQARRTNYKPRPRLLVGFDIMSYLTLWLLVVIIYHSGHWTWYFPLIMLLGISFGLIRSFRIYAKLRQISDIWQEMPPPDAMA